MAPAITLRFPADPHSRSTRSQARSPSSLPRCPATPTGHHAEARRLEVPGSRSVPCDQPTRVPDSIHCLLSSAARRVPSTPKAPLSLGFRLQGADSRTLEPVSMARMISVDQNPGIGRNDAYDFAGPLPQNRLIHLERKHTRVLGTYLGRGGVLKTRLKDFPRDIKARKCVAPLRSIAHFPPLNFWEIVHNFPPRHPD